MNLPEGYYVKEEYVDGGYIYTVAKKETNEDWKADLDAQDPKWGKYKI